MSLSGFEIAASGIISIPLSRSLVLLLYKAFGEKRLDISNLKPEKISVKSTPSATKKE